ncbi:required for drug-induced death protein 1-like [Narcine bancroftii]|uniref:required for drug-induced death protein 1-like n=1 Tax=Narcine bancroftii TaxID=1343680 RepID=UPI0038313A49
MPSENLKHTIKNQLPFTGFSNFNMRRDKHPLSEPDREKLIPIERATVWGNLKRPNTKSKQVTILPTVVEVQETEGHPLENIQGPEAVTAAQCSKKVHLTFLPDKYEPLIESLADCANEESKADQKYKRKQKLKKCKKNIFKVLRAGWHYLILGMQEFANNYTSPYPTTFSIMADMH